MTTDIVMNDRAAVAARRVSLAGSALALLLAACGDDGTTSGDSASQGSTSVFTTGDGTTTDATTSTTSPTTTDATTSTTSTTSPTTTDVTTTDATTGTTGTICDPGGINCVCDMGDCEPGLICDNGICVPGPPPPECGNGAIEEGEECDDGPNNGDTMACKSDCSQQECGDGFVGPGEGCDDGNAEDLDACSNACVPAACGDAVVQEGEACDDGNDVNTDACLDTCAAASCGDTFVQADVEECDDGNMDATDACTSECKAATCGDTFVQAGVEECDDGNVDDTDMCVAGCKAATCGDTFVQAGVEECDDGNMVDTDACVAGCKAAKCGDGLVQAGVEQCDDGNMVDNDGCSNTCKKGLKANLLRCGSSTRNVADFIPMGVNLNVVASCTPDANTQAMLITRSGVGMFNAAAVKAYVEGGGRVLTETFASDDVYNAVFNAGVVELPNLLGGCTDIAPTVVQFTPMDPFWVANGFQMVPLNQAGCGKNIAAYPMLTPLAGYSANEIAIGYRNAGMGRVWVTEFDWQDTNTVGAAYDYTEKLMGYMITNP